MSCWVLVDLCSPYSCGCVLGGFVELLYEGVHFYGYSAYVEVVEVEDV